MTERLTLELGDMDMMGRLAGVLDILYRLRLHGAGLAIDGYGNGFATLHKLKHIPAQTVKIDPALVPGLPDDADTEVIVRKSLEMAHELGIKSVAVAVGKRALLRHLRVLQCDRAQGHLIAPAMPAADIATWHTQYLPHEKCIAHCTIAASVMIFPNPKQHRKCHASHAYQERDPRINGPCNRESG